MSHSTEIAIWIMAVTNTISLTFVLYKLWRNRQ